MSTETYNYGTGDSSYRAAGEIAGIQRLVNAFYDVMDTLPEAQTIRAMHPADLSESRDKLACFLSGWLGGPRRYAKTYGPISIPSVHRHLAIGEQESQAWLRCMALALQDQPYDAQFKTYLLEQLSVPAKRIEQACRVSAASHPEENQGE